MWTRPFDERLSFTPGMIRSELGSAIPFPIALRSPVQFPLDPCVAMHNRDFGAGNFERLNPQHAKRYLPKRGQRRGFHGTVAAAAQSV